MLEEARVVQHLRRSQIPTRIISTSPSCVGSILKTSEEHNVYIENGMIIVDLRMTARYRDSVGRSRTVHKFRKTAHRPFNPS